MIKKSLKSAIGIGIGTTLGGCILPRLLLSGAYNDTWPPIWKQAILYFVISYPVAFLVFLLIEWVKSKIKSE